MEFFSFVKKIMWFKMRGEKNFGGKRKKKKSFKRGK
jgi:hypothetical protein